MLTVRVTAGHDLAERLRPVLDADPTVCDLAVLLLTVAFFATVALVARRHGSSGGAR